MNQRNRRIDISGELLLQRHGNGVKLVRPEHNIKTQDPAYSVNDILQLPVNTYFIDLNSHIHEINHVATEICSFTSRQDAIGRSVREYASKETASIIIHNDKKVFHYGTFDITEDTMVREDDCSFSALAFRFPWYDNNKLVGLMGIGIVHSHRDTRYLIDNLILLGKMGLVGCALGQNAELPHHDLKYFTSRELQVLSLVIQGKTAKRIGEELKISKRTVEHHIESIKLKSDCKSKFDLFAKFSSQVW